VNALAQCATSSGLQVPHAGRRHPQKEKAPFDRTGPFSPTTLRTGRTRARATTQRLL